MADETIVLDLDASGVDRGSRQAVDALERIRIATERVRAKQREAERASERAGDAVQTAGRKMRTVEGIQASLAAKLGRVTGAFDRMTGVAGSAEAILNALPIAGRAAARGLAVAGAAAAAFTAVLVTTVQNVDELSAKLDSSQRVELAGYIDAIRDAKSEWGEFNKAIGASRLILTGALAESIELNTRAIRGLVEASNDLANSWIGKAGVEYASLRINAAISALSPNLSLMLGQIRMLRDLAAAYASDPESTGPGPGGPRVPLNGTPTMLARVPDQIPTMLAAVPDPVEPIRTQREEVDKLATAYDSLTDAQGRTLNTSAALVGTLNEITRELESNNIAGFTQAQAWLTLNGYGDELVDTSDAVRVSLGGVAQKSAEVSKSIETDALGMTSQQQNALSSIAGFGIQLLDTTASLAGQLAQQGTITQQEAFAVQKATAIASAIVSGALAVVQAFGQLGPVAGAVAAGIVGTTVATQIALIAATQPAYHVGGRLAPDEVMMPGRAVARDNEVHAVLTAQGWDAMGPAGLADINARGTDSPYASSGNTFLIMWEGELYRGRQYAGPDASIGQRNRSRSG